MWQTLLAAVIAALLIKALDWLPKLLPVAKSGASRLSGVIGQWWSGFVVGACVAACISLAVGGMPDVKWPSIIPSIVDVTPSGPRKVLLVYESNNASPQFKGLLVSLRNGAVADHLKAKSHTLTVLDLDAKDSSGQPSPAAKAWREAFPGRQIPALVLTDQAGKVVHSEVLTDATTADSVLAIVKGHE